MKKEKNPILKCIFPPLKEPVKQQVVRVKVTKKDSSGKLEDAAEAILQQVIMMSLVYEDNFYI